MANRNTALLNNKGSYAITGNSQEGEYSPGSSKKQFTKKPPYNAIKPIPIKPSPSKPSPSKSNRRSRSRSKSRRSTSGGWWSSHSNNPHNMAKTHKMEKAAKNRHYSEKEDPAKFAAWALASGSKAKLTKQQSIGRPPKSKP